MTRTRSKLTREAGEAGEEGSARELPLGFGFVGSDFERLVEPRQLENAADGRLEPGEEELSAGLPYALQRLHQGGEARAVDEADLAEADENRPAPLGQQPVDCLFEIGSATRIELAGGGDERNACFVAQIDFHDVALAPARHSTLASVCSERQFAISAIRTAGLGSGGAP